MIEAALPVIPIARPSMGREEEAAVLEVMRSGSLAQGGKVRAFEAAFALATGGRHGIATSNGTTALHLALTAHGIGPGDEVITSPLTFIASANAIVHCGATPVFADVDSTLNLDPAAAEAAITPRTRAIMPVHLHGNPFDLPAFQALCAERGLVLIQDACQAVGARLHGRPLGQYSTAVYSLYATKNITTGEGGMVTTNEPETAARVASLRHQAYAPDVPYMHEAVGFNFRMTEIEAAIGLCQLERLQEITEQRRQNAAFLDRMIDRDRFARPTIMPGAEHVYHQYVVRVRAKSGLSRDELQEHLDTFGIASAVHYPIPVHLQPPYRGAIHLRCRQAEAAAGDMLSIPVHPQLTPADLDRIAEAFDCI